jgi:hypothetical protein
MSEKIYLGWYTDKADEGGLARNHAFKDYLEKKNFKIINLYPSNIFQRLFNIFRLTFILLKTKNSTLFLHGNFLITVYLVQIIHFKLYVYLISKILNKAAKSNDLIIEINDLRYEQSFDVKTKKVTKKFDSAERRILYELPNSKYIFASNMMREYAIKKYNLKIENTITIINGGPIKSSESEYNYHIQSNNISFVYAGTLNKGRQIEHMIDVFIKSKNTTLYLLGTGGDWIPKKYSKARVVYLGSFNERDAHKIVSQCDIGLIPYDECGFYYNLCYPTKASFYLTAGIPFLSTPLDELIDHFGSQDVCVFKEFEEWKIEIDKIDLSKLVKMKKHVQQINEKYTWGQVLEKVDNLIEV